MDLNSFKFMQNNDSNFLVQVKCLFQKAMGINPYRDALHKIIMCILFYLSYF